MTECIEDAIRTELKDSGKAPDHLFGLAFSGGGIRSATFNLGVLERLEELKLLPFVDYLSTVSGGGYIGSWYLSCRKERVKDGTERQRALDHLRQCSNYLAPQTGFFSADTWTIAMVWLRNTILLQESE
jgi:predicted acylesterase/phospholipase RssA